MRVVTGQEMLIIDRHSIAEGMPTAALMESAGLAVARAAASIFTGLSDKRIHVLCGVGNNGGDGFVAARYLRNYGAKVRVFLVGSPEKLHGEAALFYQVYVKTGGQVTLVTAVNERLRLTLSLADCFIDALLGTGAKGAPREPLASLITAVNELGKPVLAVDIPSGVESDTGKVPGAAIKAIHTVTFGLPKVGLLLYPGAALAGTINIQPIGFPSEHLNWREEGWPERIWLTHSVVKDWSKPRRKDAHKGTFGRVILVAASAGMVGAGALATTAALRVGAGLATWAGPQTLWQVMAQKVTEATTLGLPDEPPGALVPQAVQPLLAQLSPETVLAIGPGLGRLPCTLNFVVQALGKCKNRVVIDADALYALAEKPVLQGQPHPNWVITPHPGEAARLLGCSVAEVEENRLGALNRLVSAWQCVVVLKGAPTLVSSPAGTIYINSTGNPGMATGGCGDVLTGIIAGLMAQGLAPVKAAAAGVYLHGATGDTAALHGEAGLLAGDLAGYLPETLAKCWETA